MHRHRCDIYKSTCKTKVGIIPANLLRIVVHVVLWANIFIGPFYTQPSSLKIKGHPL